MEKDNKNKSEKASKIVLPKTKALKNTGKFKCIAGGHAQTMTIADCIHA